MATLTIRDFPDKERERLRRRAAAAGRSMEAEARRILLQGLSTPKKPASESNDWLKKVQALVAKSTKKRAPGDLMSEQFLRERRAMWGEE